MTMSTDIVLPYPGRAISWIRQEVRLVAAGLADEADRAKATTWLDDLITAGVAVRELRSGSGSYAFQLITARGARWIWAGHDAARLSALTAPEPHPALAGRTPTH
ncbi:hypothetical protein [Streptomyces sp. 769]|uniref:hypothetical protein n=1 Tax=Streptomyces sp. 769 TaxID=1262452 RepID=UPI00057CD6E4|nr:hypothetical protein [Streptomyces sp. 769]AJC58577.1 hypothetical protein GZL_06004 [Streptomyces sp. 769]